MFAPERDYPAGNVHVIVYTLKVIGQLPQGSSGKRLSDFTDASQVGTWAQEAMAAFVATGIVQGSSGKLNPTDTTTRAEMAQVLYNLLYK